MKYILILLVLFSLNTQAQDSIPPRRGSLVTLALFSGSVIMGGIGDGLNSRAHYASGHLLNAASVASLIAVPLLVKISGHDKFRYLASYVLIRYAFFDMAYNKAAQRPANFMGGKNYYDETLSRIPTPVINGSKALSLGFVFMINSGRKHTVNQLK
jgi:hypothetical protein